MGRMKRLEIMLGDNIHIPAKLTAFMYLPNGSVFFQEPDSPHHFMKIVPIVVQKETGCATCNSTSFSTWNAVNATGSQVHFCPSEKVYKFMDGLDGH